LAGAALASGMTALAARAAGDDLGTTPRNARTAAVTGNEPAWLSGVDPNVIPASGLLPSRSANDVQPLGPPPLGATQQPAASTGLQFPKLFNRSKNPSPPVPMTGAIPAPNPNAAIQGATSRGSPLLAGPPAYRWFGYGAPTPGANNFAPSGSGQYPRGSANWFGVTGATPGAFPTSVVNPLHAAPGNEPPTYAAAPMPVRPMPIVRNPAPRPAVAADPPAHPPLPDYLLSEDATPRQRPVHTGSLPPPQLSKMELPPPQMLPPPRMEEPTRTALPPLPEPVGVPQLPQPIHHETMGKGPNAPALPPLPEPIGASAGPQAPEMPAAPTAPVKHESAGPVAPLPPDGILMPPEKPHSVKEPAPIAKPASVPDPMKPIIGLPVPSDAKPLPLPPAVAGDPWQATPANARPAKPPGAWGPVAPAAPLPPLPPPNLSNEPGASNAKPAAIVRGQMPDLPRTDPMVMVVQNVCRGRAAGVDVRWTGSKKLMVCFEVRTAAEAEHLVRDISARRELAPLAIDFCALVK